jgi:hypothetical protein
MPTRGERPKLGEAAKAVADHASALAKLELRLATLELKQKARALAIGVGAGIGAALFGLLGLTLAIGGAVAGVATALPVWAALLVVAGGAFLLSALLGLVALGRFARATPPMPEQAIEEARLTTEALRSANGRH